MLAGDFRSITENTNVTATSGVTGSSVFKIILRLIVEWDLTNEKEEPLPITEDSIDFLPMTDFTVLADHAGKIGEASTIDSEVKKN